jgi:hypothetical protein
VVSNTLIGHHTALRSQLKGGSINQRRRCRRARAEALDAFLLLLALTLRWRAAEVSHAVCTSFSTNNARGQKGPNSSEKRLAYVRRASFERVLSFLFFGGSSTRPGLT